MGKSEFLSTCIAYAPSSTANIGPGYDVFGLGLDAFQDKVILSRMPTRSNRITIRVTGENNNSSNIVPSKLESNSAGLVIKKMSNDFGIDNDLDVNIYKGVPVGLGMGSSAASAAAAAIAFDKLFDLSIEKPELIEYAAEGEIASAGVKHYDNVSASVLGGFVIVRTSPELEFIRIEPPEDLVLVIAVPLISVPKGKTGIARSILPTEVPLSNVVVTLSNASTVVAGFILKDTAMMARGIRDVIVEPARRDLIPGYDAVKRNALEAGSLAVTISGAGPSMISFLKTTRDAKRVAKAMAVGFNEASIKSRTFISHASNGARVIKTS
ncbi:MAG TPA: homoserine kinase [Nitrososphaeraceae archaeon]|nr:homoserine kinase [Nitrososphaeraceae archaeon]